MPKMDLIRNIGEVIDDVEVKTFSILDKGEKIFNF